MSLDPPLGGYRVLDFSTLLPGPALTAALVAMGAEVVKVEPPGGDPARSLYGGMLFAPGNAGKLSIELNLKDAADHAIALGLLRSSDVVVHGFRPAAARRLGIGYDRAVAVKPDIVYCALSGYGSGEEWAGRPGHDLSFLARGGALGAPGNWASRGRPPARPLLPIADLAGAALGAQAVVAALLQRERCGQGRYLEIALQAAVLSWAGFRADGALVGLDLPDPAPFHDPANDVYTTADGGAIAIAAVEQSFWRRLCDVVAPLLALPDGATEWSWPERQAHGDELSAALADIFLRRTRAEWIETLESADVPADPVLSLREAFQDGWAVSQRMVSNGLLRWPLPFDVEPSPPPALDQHGEALRWEAARSLDS